MIEGTIREAATFFEQLGAGDRPILDPRERLVVAVSGGADSLALLHLLIKQSIKPAESLIVAHLDHGWRQSGAEDAQFVANIAAEWGASTVIERADTITLSRTQGLTLEEAGRQARYRFLAQTAKEHGATAVATGHSADDQVETVLMHFLRGSGLAGLRGMQAITMVPGSADILLIRPLLKVFRQSIEEYCQTFGLEVREDPSNRDPAFFRNRLRHELLPALAKYSPQFSARALRLAAIADAEYAFLAEAGEAALTEVRAAAGEGWVRLEKAVWQRLPLALRRYTLRRAANSLLSSPHEVGFTGVEAARQLAEHGRTGSQAHLAGGIRLAVNRDALTIYLEATGKYLPDLPQLSNDVQMTLPVPGQRQLAGNWAIEAEAVDDFDLEAIQDASDPWTVHLSVPKVQELIVRSRLQGERFQPLGLGGRSTRVKKVMIERQIPAALRAQWPIVANRDHLLWLVGHHLDERARLTAGQRKAVRLRVFRLGSGDH